MPNPGAITPAHNRLLATLSSDVSTLLGCALHIRAYVSNRNFCRRCRTSATDALGPGRT